ncbi:hypothetical protein BJX61DRAFT_509975 [Aspergillus egyptiacus]|nr:hypothetical protein BJX61DRAFT_509975 [Aspergillus egyptiacus]
MSTRYSERSSPQTPHHQSRSNNSSFASTSSGFRVEEDAVIFELGARWLRAGFEGESEPKCIVGFGPEESRRVGDYRGWLRGTVAAPEEPRPAPATPEDWTRPYELWNMDLRDVDLGLFEDKLERAFRETYNKYLLTDAGLGRLVLVLPSLLPHPLLSSILTTLFNRWRIPSITLLSSAAMATAAAGLRSALVVDIGWAETIVTGIYEYREISTKRTTRAMKTLVQETGRMISQISNAKPQPQGTISVDFEFAEEVASRFLWCSPWERLSDYSRDLDPMAEILQKTVSIPSPSEPGSSYIDLPFSKFTEPVEKVLFAQGVADSELDDEEKSIPLVVYNTLLSLPPDVRGICMSRIVYTGGGANIAGIRRRIIDEVNHLIEQYGWSPVRGKVIDQQLQQRLQSLKLFQQPPSSDPATSLETKDPDPGYLTAGYETEAGYETAVSQAEEEPEPPQQTAEQQPTKETTIAESPADPDAKNPTPDPVEQKLLRTRDKDVVPPVQGILREVETLGPWSGASLITSLKIRGLVEIEREKYLQQGLAGASREAEHAHSHREAQQHSVRELGSSYNTENRRSLRAGDRSSWTLAGWGL